MTPHVSVFYLCLPYILGRRSVTLALRVSRSPLFLVHLSCSGPSMFLVPCILGPPSTPASLMVLVPLCSLALNVLDHPESPWLPNSPGPPMCVAHLYCWVLLAEPGAGPAFRLVRGTLLPGVPPSTEEAPGCRHQVKTRRMGAFKAQISKGREEDIIEDSEQGGVVTNAGGTRGCVIVIVDWNGFERATTKPAERGKRNSQRSGSEGLIWYVMMCISKASLACSPGHWDRCQSFFLLGALKCILVNSNKLKCYAMLCSEVGKSVYLLMFST